MNRWQKIAWYNITVILLTFVLATISVTVLAFKYGFPKAFAGLGMLGFLGLLGLSAVIFKKPTAQVDFDERDKLIFYKSLQITYALFWPIFTAGCMIPWFIIGPFNKTVPTNVFPIMLGSIGITLTFIQSLATLIQYGFKSKGEKNE